MADSNFHVNRTDPSLQVVSGSKYIFQSQRLGFRNWLPTDLEPLSAINSDPEVMEFFPSLPTARETQTFIENMNSQYNQYGYCYFAVELLATGDFIGFIGLCNQTYEAFFTPCVDIGWRLGREYWYQGYASEGALCCLNFAFTYLRLAKVFAVAPAINHRSVAVMEKIGMQFLESFAHPKLLDTPRLRDCVVYLAEAPKISF